MLGGSPQYIVKAICQRVNDIVLNVFGKRHAKACAGWLQRFFFDLGIEENQPLPITNVTNTN